MKTKAREVCGSGQKNGDEADIYRVKKIQRNGDDLNYVMRMRKEDNLSSNKYHPTKAAQAVSTRK